MLKRPMHQNGTNVCNRYLFNTLLLLDTSLFYFNTLEWCWHLWRTSPLHWTMTWPPVLVRQINNFIKFHILYSFLQNPQYQRSLLTFDNLLSTSSHSQIERRKSLIWWSSSWVILDTIFRSYLLQLIAPQTQEEGSVSRIKRGRKISPWYTQQ